MSSSPTKQGVIGKIIAASVNNKFIAIAAVAFLGAWGWFSLKNAPLDALPDLSDTQVIVFTEWQGRGPQLVEDQVTYPISSKLLAAPKVTSVRGQSFFGLSFVYVIFEEGTDMYWARSRVLEYMASATAELPEGVTPTLGPDATGVGWVFQYALIDRSGGQDLAELRSLQDFTIRYALESVPGVAEVASVGGFVKQYQLLLDPSRLRALGIGAQEVVRAVRDSNRDVGGRVLELAGHEHVVRGRGYVESIADLEDIPIRVEPGGVPVYVKNVAEVSIGPDMRRGLADLNGEGEAVGGIVIMRYGENALAVIDRVKERIEEVRRSLPEGVELIVTYDRSELIEASIDTLTTTLIEEMIVVSLIIFIFLLHVRSALILVIALPTAVLLSFIPFAAQGLTVSIMSLGGIAVAIGAMVDASIIIVENIHKSLEEWEAGEKKRPRTEVLIEAMQEVGPSVFFSLLVITVSFLPVFTLEGVEGRLFKPLAFGKTYAMGFASILAVTLTPALAAIFIRGRIRSEEKNPLNLWLVAAYVPVVRFVVTHRVFVIATAVVLMAFTVPVALRLQSEFMPPLNEGVILYMPTAPPGMSEEEAARTVQAIDAKLKAIPEVNVVFGKMGRARTATDPAPLSMAEVVVLLEPRSKWRAGVSWDDLIREMDQSIQIPGMLNIWWMPIQTRTEMLSTGVRSKLGIKVFGNTLAEIEDVAKQIEAVVPEIEGTRSAFAERLTGGFFIDFRVKRRAAARHGLRVSDVNEVVMSAIGGINISTTVEGRERYPIAVRYAREYRDDPDALGKVLVHPPAGGAIPLQQVADIEITTGPPMIRSEGGKLVGFVFVDIDEDQALGTYVDRAKALVNEKVSLPPGTRLEWAGQFRYLERAKEKLTLVIPLTLAIVFFLLYLSTRSVVETLIVLLAVPFSLIGAFWLLYILDYNLSIAVWVGIIALAGLDAETGIVMLLYLKLAYRKRQKAGEIRTSVDLREVIVEGAARRVRPKLMTVLTTIIGLTPILFASGAGADVMKRISAPMVGGLVTSFLLELTIYPALFAVWKGHQLRNAQPSAQVESIEIDSEDKESPAR